MAAVRSMATFESVRVTPRGALCEVLLDRPKKLNAVDLAMIRECDAAVDAAEAHAAAVGGKAVLALRGAGTKAFCAGGDVAAVRAAGLAGPPADGAEPLYTRRGPPRRRRSRADPHQPTPA